MRWVYRTGLLLREGPTSSHHAVHCGRPSQSRPWYLPTGRKRAVKKGDHVWVVVLRVIPLGSHTARAPTPLGGVLRVQRTKRH